MSFVKHTGVCKKCGYEWDIRKLDAKGSRVCPKCRGKDVEIEEREVSSDTENASLDPEVEFKDILQDLGINRARDTITRVFFRGDIDDVDWLEEVLAISSIPKNKREMVKGVWFGLPSEMLESDGDNVRSGRDKKSKSLDDVMEEEEMLLAKEIKLARAKQMLRKYNENEDDKSNKKTVRIPATNQDGTIMIGPDNKPVFIELSQEELKEMQLSKQYMQQYQPREQKDSMQEWLMKQQMELTKLIIAGNNNNKTGDNEEIRKLQNKIEEMNTMFLDKKLNDMYGSFMAELNKLRAQGGTQSEIDDLLSKADRLKKLGINVFGGNNINPDEIRRDRVLDEGLDELKGLRNDISNKADPFIEIAAESARSQLRDNNPEKKKTIDKKSKVTDEEVESIIKSLDPDSKDSTKLDKEFPDTIPHKDDNKDIDSIKEENKKPDIKARAIIFSDNETKIWDGENENVIETKVKENTDKTDNTEVIKDE